MHWVGLCPLLVFIFVFLQSEKGISQVCTVVRHRNKLLSCDVASFHIVCVLVWIQSRCDVVQHIMSANELLCVSGWVHPGHGCARKTCYSLPCKAGNGATSHTVTMQPIASNTSAMCAQDCLTHDCFILGQIHSKRTWITVLSTSTMVTWYWKSYRHKRGANHQRCRCSDMFSESLGNISSGWKHVWRKWQN